jgi:hypothetical protein
VLESYIENAIEFIEQGIRGGDQVLFVENTRIYPMIQRKLEERLTAEEMEKFHYVNNFDFYWTHGNFHPQTIQSLFERFVSRDGPKRRKRADMGPYRMERPTGHRTGNTEI